MGIWIRSQGKEVLIKSNDIWVEDKRIFANLFSSDAGNTGTCLGVYSTEDEAMKVLDMVQSQIEASEYFKCVGRDMPCPELAGVNFVFQMPPN